MLDAILISIAIPIARWLGWVVDRVRPTKRTASMEAEHTTSLLLEKYKKLLEEELAKEKEPAVRRDLEQKLEEAKAALIGYYQRILERALERSDLPVYGELVASGKRVVDPADKAKLSEAIRHLDLEAPPPTADDFIASATAKYALERYEGALADYNQALKLRPDDPVALNNRGVTYGTLGRYEEALSDLHKALQLKQDDVTAINNLGVTYLKMGTAYKKLEHYGEALTHLNKAISLKPDYIDAIGNRGTAYLRLERYEDALDAYNQVLQLKPDDVTAINNRGVTYLKLKRYDEALADFNKALQLKPDFSDALYNVACLFSLTAKIDDSIAYMEKAISGDEKLRQDAAVDSDFDNIRHDPRFRRLVEGS